MFPPLFTPALEYFPQNNLAPLSPGQNNPSSSAAEFVKNKYCDNPSIPVSSSLCSCDGDRPSQDLGQGPGPMRFITSCFYGIVMGAFQTNFLPGLST